MGSTFNYSYYVTSRMHALLALSHEYHIYVRSVISNSIVNLINAFATVLGHLCVITTLHTNYGVPTETRHIMVKPKTPMNMAYFEKLVKKILPPPPPHAVEQPWEVQPMEKEK